MTAPFCVTAQLWTRKFPNACIGPKVYLYCVVAQISGFSLPLRTIQRRRVREESSRRRKLLSPKRRS